MGLYHKYRPKTFDEIIGQDAAVKTLKKLLEKKFPQALLLTGPSGVGKTTIARILKTSLKCGDKEFREFNCAESGNMETVREIKDGSRLAIIGGKSRIWYLDEAQAMSRTTFAQQGLLKLLEDPKPNNYIILSTTDVSKLIKTIHTRCTEVQLKGIRDDEITKLIQDVAKQEKGKIVEEVVLEITKVAEGSARKALVILEQLIDLESTEEQVAAIELVTGGDFTVKLCRALLDERNPWSDIKKLIKENSDDLEKIRRGVLGYMSAVIQNVSGKKEERCFNILNEFSGHWYDCGKAGLWLACYQLYH